LGIHFRRRGSDLRLGLKAHLVYVRLGGSDCRLIGMQRRCGGIEFLLSCRLFLYQGKQTIVILLGFHKVCLRGGQVGLGLQESDLFLSKFPVRLALGHIAFGLFDCRLIGTQIQDV